MREHSQQGWMDFCRFALYIIRVYCDPCLPAKSKGAVRKKKNHDELDNQIRSGRRRTARSAFRILPRLGRTDKSVNARISQQLFITSFENKASPFDKPNFVEQMQKSRAVCDMQQRLAAFPPEFDKL